MTTGNLNVAFVVLGGADPAEIRGQRFVPGATVPKGRRTGPRGLFVLVRQAGWLGTAAKTARARYEPAAGPATTALPALIGPGD